MSATRDPASSEFARQVVRGFRSELHDFWTESGSPPAREMVKRVERFAFNVGRNQINDAKRLDLTSMPTWEAVRCVLRACGASQDVQDEWKRRRGNDEQAIANAAAGTVRRQARDDLIWRVPVVRRRVLFEGRSRLMAVVDRHLSERTAPIVLRGVPGMGKTQIAAHVAHLAQNRYDIVWMIDGSSAMSARAGLAALGARLPGGDAAALTEQALADRAASHLRTADRWLLIVDGAEDPGLFGDVIPDLSGAMIITASDGNWEHVGRVEEVAPISRAAALRVLGTTSGTRRDRDELVETIGGIPLVLQYARAAMSDRYTPAEYLQRLRDHLRTTLQMPSGAGDYLVTAGAAWEVSFTLAQTRSDSALELFEMLSFGADAPFPVVLLERPPDASAASGLPLEARSLAATIKVLTDLVLVNLADGTLAFHGLIARFARERSSDPAGAKQALVHQLSRALPFDSDEIGGDQLWRAAAPHAISVCGRYDDDDASDVRERIWLLDRAGTWRFAHGAADEAVTLLRRSTKLARRHLAPTDVLRLWTTNNLLLADVELGLDINASIEEFTDLAALYELAASAAAGTTGSADPLVPGPLALDHADTIHNLGFVHLRHGSYDDAVDCLTTARDAYLDLRDAHPGRDLDRAVCRVNINLAWAANMRGDLRAAEAAASTARSLLRTADLVGDRDEAWVLTNLANATRVEDPREATRLARGAVRLKVALYGTDHPETLDSECVLAAAQREWGLLDTDSRRTTTALNDHRRIVAVARRIGTHSAQRVIERALHETGVGFWALAVVRQRAGRPSARRGRSLSTADLLSEARGALVEALRLRTTRLDASHPLVIRVAIDLARVRRSQNGWQDGIVLLQDAIEAIGGRYPQLDAEAHAQLALCAYDDAGLKTARRFAQVALSLRERHDRVDLDAEVVVELERITRRGRRT